MAYVLDEIRNLVQFQGKQLGARKQQLLLSMDLGTFQKRGTHAMIFYYLGGNRIFALKSSM